MLALGAFLVGTLLSAQTVQFIAGPHLTLSVGNDPVAVAINPTATTAYVVNATDNTLSVIDTRKNTVLANVPVGVSPDSLAVNPAGTLVYVANATDNTVSVIDAATNLVTATVPVGSNPSGVTVNPAGTSVYVTNSVDNTVSVVAASTNTVTATIAVGNGPQAITVNAAGTFAYVTNDSDNTVSVIDLANNTVTATVSVGVHPDAIAVNGAGTYAYVANFNDNTVSVINLATNAVTATITVGNSPVAITLSPTGTRAYVANIVDSTVSVIDTDALDPNANTVLATPRAGIGPDGLAVSPNGTFGYVANGSTNSVYEVTLGAANFGSMSVTTPTTPQILTFSIAAGTTIGTVQVLTAGATGLDFAGTNTSSPCAAKTYASATSCTVNLTFTPAFPGVRMGAIVFGDPNGNVLATVPIYGTGIGAEIGFAPAIATALDAGILNNDGLVNPTAMAIDGAGNLYVTNHFSNRIVQIPASGTPKVLTVTGETLGNLNGVAVDGAGNVFVADRQNSRVVEVTPTGVATVFSVSGVGVIDPEGLAIDGAGNLYITDDVNNRIVKVTPTGVGSVLSTGSLTLSSPNGLAVDAAGDVFVADLSNNRVVELAADDTASVVSTGSVKLAPRGVAVDAAGDLYIVDLENLCIVEVSSTGVASVLNIGTPDGTALNSPQAIALDGAGNVYIADTGNARIVELAQSQPSPVTFATSTIAGNIDTVDGPLTTTVENLGNDALVFSTPASGTNPNYPASFPENGADANLCSSSTPLAIGATCDVSINFSPATGGNLTGSVVLTDNSLNAAGPNYVTQSIALSGTAWGSTVPQVSFTPAATSQSYGAAIGAGVLDATASYNGSPVAGTFVYTAAVAGSGPGTVNAGSVLTTGTYVLTATFTPTDNVTYQPASATAAYTVTVASATVTLGGLSQTYTGAPIIPVVTTNPANLVVALTYNGGTTAPTAPGSYAVAATIYNANYQGSATGTLTVSQASDVTSVSASANSVNPGASVTLTAQVTSAASGYPTGTVSFLDNGTLLGTAPLAAGSATYTTSTLTVGMADSITATYSGDADFLPSTSTAATVTVGTLDFTMSIQGASTQSVAAGATATYQLAVSPTYGSFAGTVSFAVTGLPTGATAMFSPSSLPANSGSKVVSMAIQTAAATARLDSMPRTSNGGKRTPMALAILLLLGVGSMRKRARSLRSMAGVALLLIAGSMASLVIGCGGGSNAAKGGTGGTGTTPTPVNYTLTITATSGALHHASTATLTVQ